MKERGLGLEVGGSVLWRGSEVLFHTLNFMNGSPVVNKISF